jgi:hypothetical protein
VEIREKKVGAESVKELTDLASIKFVFHLVCFSFKTCFSFAYVLHSYLSYEQEVNWDNVDQRATLSVHHEFKLVH